MKIAKAASFFFQKTVSGTQKYAVADRFPAEMAILKGKRGSDSQSLDDFPTRAALRRHPCHLSLPPLALPEQLDYAATEYLREHSLYSVKLLKQLSARLVNYLHERELLSEDELLERIKSKPKKIIEQEDNFEFIDAGIESVLQFHRAEDGFPGANREERQTRRTALSEWKSLTYSQKNSELYLVGRLAPNFAVACRVLYEIRKRCPLFVPKVLFDFASGLGTYTWVANTVWPAGCIREHYLVEASGPMSALSEFLLARRGKGVAPGETVFPGVRHRRFTPSSQVTAGLVMSGYSLLEMVGEVDRRHVVESLWSRTTGFLVLIEEGTKAGHSALMEARDFLIRKGGEDVHIFAPCPNTLTCGKMGLGCKANARYYAFGLTNDATYPSDEAFSYLVVSRGDWRQYTKEGSSDGAQQAFPRIVSQCPESVSSVLDIDLCLPGGDCERVTFSKSGTHRDLYFFLRNSHAADIAPCVRLEPNPNTTGLEESE